MLLWQEVHYYMVYIVYFTELNLKICDYVQKRRIFCENCKYALDERFHGHFCPRRKPAKSCHPELTQQYIIDGTMVLYSFRVDNRRQCMKIQVCGTSQFKHEWILYFHSN